MNLIRQGAASATEDGPRGGGEQHPIIDGHLFRGQDEHPARLAEERASGAALEVGLEPVTGVARALIHDDEVQIQATAPCIGVPLHELADEGLVVWRDDPDQQNRNVTGDAMRPQAPLAEAIGGDGISFPQPRTGENDRPRQLIEQGNVIRRQVELP